MLLKSRIELGSLERRPSCGHLDLERNQQAWASGTMVRSGPPAPVFNYFHIRKSEFTVQNGQIILTSCTAGACLKHFLPSIIRQASVQFPSLSADKLKSCSHAIHPVRLRLVRVGTIFSGGSTSQDSPDTHKQVNGEEDRQRDHR